MSAEEGHQSPPPERQSDRQINQPAGGQGTDNADHKDKTNQSGLDNLQSNPKGPLEDAVKEKFSKTQK